MVREVEWNGMEDCEAHTWRRLKCQTTRVIYDIRRPSLLLESRSDLFFLPIAIVGQYDN